LYKRQGNVPTLELSARLVPSYGRGLFFSQRSFWGGILGFMAGFLVQGILGQTETFPANFALLFFAAFCALGFATYFTAMMQEAPQPYSEQRTTFLSHLADAPQLFTNAAFRRFLGFRVALSLSAIADPFYVVYVQQQLGARRPYGAGRRMFQRRSIKAWFPSGSGAGGFLEGRRNRLVGLRGSRRPPW
jgi:hypothetical protein